MRRVVGHCTRQRRSCRKHVYLLVNGLSDDSTNELEIGQMFTVASASARDHDNLGMTHKEENLLGW